MAENYKDIYTLNDGSCDYPGCTDSTYANYFARATFDIGQCTNDRRSLRGEDRRLSSGCLNPAAMEPFPKAGGLYIHTLKMDVTSDAEVQAVRAAVGVWVNLKSERRRLLDGVSA